MANPAVQPAPPEPPELQPRSALQSTWLLLRQHMGRQVLVVGGLCLGIALLLTALTGRRFVENLVYSLCIGTACTLIVGSVRLLVAWGHDRLRLSRGLPHVDEVNGWHGVIPGALLAALIGPSMGMTLADAITGNRSVSLLDLGASSARVTLVLGLLGTVMSVVVIGSLERLASARAQAEAAQRQAAEHQLRLLQSQLEPHMLFNTLANLRVLIGLDAARAQAMLDSLIAYLRATLNASRLAAHPLATEFERIADYLSLMAVRMGPRLQTQLDLPEVLRDLPVPPLLLQPLVENAIKHGLEPHVQGGRITVTARRLRQTLVLTVRDTGIGLRDGASTAPGSQFGLAQVRKRLATLHGDKASLTLQAVTDADGGGTLATLTMPWPTAA